MLAVVWLDEAITDLIDIVTFIAAENPGAARRIKSRLEGAPLPLPNILISTPMAVCQVLAKWWCILTTYSCTA